MVRYLHLLCERPPTECPMRRRQNSITAGGGTTRACLIVVCHVRVRLTHSRAAACESLWDRFRGIIIASYCGSGKGTQIAQSPTAAPRTIHRVPARKRVDRSTFLVFPSVLPSAAVLSTHHAPFVCHLTPSCLPAGPFRVTQPVLETYRRPPVTNSCPPMFGACLGDPGCTTQAV